MAEPRKVAPEIDVARAAPDGRGRRECKTELPAASPATRNGRAVGARTYTRLVRARYRAGTGLALRGSLAPGDMRAASLPEAVARSSYALLRRCAAEESIYSLIYGRKMGFMESSRRTETIAKTKPGQQQDE